MPLKRGLAAAAALCMLAVVSAASSAAVPITYPSYPQVLQRLRALAIAAPHLVELWNAQERFGVPSPGSCGEEECKHWFLTLSNRSAATPQPPPSSAPGSPLQWLVAAPLSRRPHVFLSGNLHGDEVVGPVTILHLLEDLVAARLRGDNPWLNHLVDSRVLVAIPVTNPLGFFSRTRSENDMDPNRDFPFMTGGANCMRTTVARAVNEAFRAHLFPLAITFHGGMQSITYEWGAPNHYDAGSRSPDDASQRAVGLAMAEAAGAFQGSRYPVGRTNSVVYPVTGGMEDWAYAGSWEPDPAARTPCSPTTYGGYAAERTTYGPAELRALNMLVETADMKRPLESALGVHGPAADPATWALPADGTSASAGGSSGTAVVDASASLGTLAGVLAVEGPGDGHVPRNMRLILAALDMALPYVKATRWRVAPAAAGGAAAAAPRAAAALFVDTAATLTDASAQQPQSRARQVAAAAADANAPVVVGASCTEVSASGGGMVGMTNRLCSRHAGEYAPGDWIVSELPPTTNDPSSSSSSSGSGGTTPSSSGDARATLAVGWDVGGGFWVHDTALAVAAWDVRVPPSFLLAAAIGDISAYPPDLTAASVPADVVADLQQAHGLSAPEAAAFAFHVRLLQLVLAGKLPLEQLPSQAAIWRSAPKSGPTRWLHGTIANAAPAAGTGAGAAAAELNKASPLTVELQSAAVQGMWSAEQGRAVGGVTNPLSRVAGAPDLARHPFVTRFSQCVRLPSPLQPASADGSPASPCAAGRRAAATADAAHNSLLRGSSGDAHADSASISHDVPRPRSAGTSTHRVTRAFVVFPYAVVDKDWATAEQPASPGGTPPQGHLANARTNPAWVHSNAGVTIEGRALFTEAPRFVALTAVVPVVVPEPSPEPQPEPQPSESSSPSPAATVAASPSGSSSEAPAGGNGASSNTDGGSSGSSSSIAPSTCPEVRLPSGTNAAVTGAVTAANVVSIGGVEVSASGLVAYAALVTGGLAFVLLVAAVRCVRQRRRGAARLAAAGAAARAAAPASAVARASRYEDRARLAPYSDAPSGEAAEIDDSRIDVDDNDDGVDAKAVVRSAAAATAPVAPAATAVAARAVQSRVARPASRPAALTTAAAASAFDDSDDSDVEALAAVSAAAAGGPAKAAALAPSRQRAGAAAGRLAGPATAGRAAAVPRAAGAVDDAVERAVRALEEADSGSELEDAL